jgi:hypothetical protein
VIEAVVVDAVRTPIGRYGGALPLIRPDDLSAIAIPRSAGAQSGRSVISSLSRPLAILASRSTRSSVKGCLT